MGNFGPGFDSLSLALGPIGDAIRLRDAEADEIRVVGADLPSAWSSNAVGAVLDHLRQATGRTERFRVDLAKGVPPGSGLGSSAASSAVAAIAFARAFGPVSRELLLEAAVAGEARVSGPHRDDVAASLFGGLALVDPDSWGVRSLPPPRHLRLAVLRPHVVLETKRMRAVLPAAVPRADVVANLSATARLVAAFVAGDVASVGAALTDRIATPHRAPLVPLFAESERAARAEGAYGFALSGSGPAMIAVAEGDAHAARVADALFAVAREAKVEATAFVGVPEGVRDLSSLVY